MNFNREDTSVTKNQKIPSNITNSSPMTQKRHRIFSIALGVVTYLLLWMTLKSLLSIDGKEKISAVALMIPISIFKFFMKDPQEDAIESARIRYQNLIDAYSGYVLALIFTLLYSYAKP